MIGNHAVGFNWNAVETATKTPRAKQQPPVRPVRVPVLITHQAGELQFYGPDGLNPLFLNLPRVDSVEGELALERLLESVLPWSVKNIFWPGYLRGGGLVRDLDLHEMENRVDQIGFDSALMAMGLDRQPLHGRGLILEALRG